MGMESRCGLMALSSRAIGKTIWPMAGEPSFMWMAMSTMGSGWQIKLMDLVCTRGLGVSLATAGTGRGTSRMGKGGSSGVMGVST